MIWADYHQFRKSTHFSRFLSLALFPWNRPPLEEVLTHTQAQVASKRQGSEDVLATIPMARILMRNTVSSEHVQPFRFWWGILVWKLSGAPLCCWWQLEGLLAAQLLGNYWHLGATTGQLLGNYWARHTVRNRKLWQGLSFICINYVNLALWGTWVHYDVCAQACQKKL